MNRLPRLLVIIGSGELAAQMTRGHRMIARRLQAHRARSRPSDIRAAIIDTPYGFQENADSLSETLLDYFGRRIGLTASIATFRRADADVLSRERAFALIREAQFVFSGPGSPSYAIRQWARSPIAELLTDKLLNGGAVVFASAAALTLGKLTVPVYEIYKGGDDPTWLPGLNVLGAIGIDAAVIPHFDNTEGGTHDTRYCYLGERRLRMLEEQMPDDGSFILGVDEHTAIMLDLDAGAAAVHGRGAVTIRRRGTAQSFENGQTIDLKELRAGPITDRQPAASGKPTTSASDNDQAAVAQRLVEMERDRAAAMERGRLVHPLIQALLEVRNSARERGDYATADEIRDRLVTLGVNVSDLPTGTSVRLRGRSHG